MKPAAMFSYAVSAGEYAVLATLALLVAFTLVTRRLPTPSLAALLLSAAFVVFLGLYPFPPPEEVICKEPILDPRAVADGYIWLWRKGAPLSVWLTTLWVITPVANFVLFAVVGAFLAAQTRRWAVAAALGAGVSGFIEIAQLSGLFGVYDCPYRTFETADLILNVGGVLCGFGVAHRVAAACRRRHGARTPS